MAKKIENNFYDRFLAVKPPAMNEAEWFAKFGWTGNEMSTRKLSWKRIEFPDPSTIIKIHTYHSLTAEEIVYLQYGTEVETVKMPLSIALGESKTTSAGE